MENKTEQATCKSVHISRFTFEKSLTTVSKISIGASSRRRRARSSSTFAGKSAPHAYKGNECKHEKKCGWEASEKKIAMVALFGTPWGSFFSYMYVCVYMPCLRMHISVCIPRGPDVNASIAADTAVNMHTCFQKRLPSGSSNYGRIVSENFEGSLTFQTRETFSFAIFWGGRNLPSTRCFGLTHTWCFAFTERWKISRTWLFTTVLLHNKSGSNPLLVRICEIQKSVLVELSACMFIFR